MQLDAHAVATKCTTRCESVERKSQRAARIEHRELVASCLVVNDHERIAGWPCAHVETVDATGHCEHVSAHANRALDTQRLLGGVQRRDVAHHHVPSPGLAPGRLLVVAK